MRECRSFQSLDRMIITKQSTYRTHRGHLLRWVDTDYM